MSQMLLWKIGAALLIVKVIAMLIGAVPGVSTLPFISSIVKANILWAIGAGLLASGYRIMMIPIGLFVFFIITLLLIVGGLPLW